MNPHIDSSSQGGVGSEVIGIEAARVVTVPSHSEGDKIGHAIEVKPSMFDEPIIADVRVDQLGDVSLPTEGDRVTIAYRANGRPHVLGSRYSVSDSIPAFEEGVRVIGHSVSDSHIRFEKDGTLRLVGDDGNKVELQPDGSIVVNGGDKRAVTDIETSASDGYITGISVTRANDVYLPSE